MRHLHTPEPAVQVNDAQGCSSRQSPVVWPAVQPVRQHPQTTDAMTMQHVMGESVNAIADRHQGNTTPFAPLAELLEWHLQLDSIEHRASSRCVAFNQR